MTLGAAGLSQEFSLASTHLLNNDVPMPRLGLGVWQVEDGATVEKTTRFALDNGYCLIDTASIYRNEKGVGLGIARAGVARNLVFVTSKLWNEDIRQGNEQAAFVQSLQKLNLEYLDLYLAHWPIAEKLDSSWKALEKIYTSGKAKAVGVSNYHVPHLQQLAKTSKLVPAVNQIECHPLLQQREVRQYCKDHGIAVQAWSPLMQGQFQGIPTLEKLSIKHKKSVPQILLRWNMQSNILTIPKSANEQRILENAQIFDYALDEQDMNDIAALDCGKRFGPDPDNFNF